jgi:hypothetical protein
MKNNRKPTTKKNINESALRSMLRKEIARILEADNAEEEEAPEEEAPKEPAEEEEGLSADMESATQLYIRKLKDAGSVESNDLVEMISNIIEAFAESSEHKLSILKAVKTNIVH